MIAKNKQRITVTLDKDVLSYIRYKAEKENLTVSEYVNNIFKYRNVSYRSNRFVYSFLEKKLKKFCDDNNIKMEFLSFRYHIKSAYFSFSFLDSCGKRQTGKVTMDGVFIDE